MERQYGYLLALLRAFVLEQQPPEAENVDWQQLELLAQVHNVSGILGYMSMAYSIAPKERSAALRQICLSTMALYAQRAAQAQRLFSELEASGICYCTMKGLEVRQFYPVPELRTFSDVDFLIKAQDRKRCHEWMLAQGFTVKTDWEPVYSYLRGQEYYEIHTQIMEVELSDKADYRGYFDRAWDFSEPVSPFGCRLKPEFHLIYLLTHIAKHARGSGAGIRMYLDIAAFLRHNADSLDWIWLRQELHHLALWQFACTVFSCVESWFGVKVPEEFRLTDPRLQERFLAFTMEAGVFGKFGRETGLSSVKNNGSDSRAVVLLKRVFPRAQDLQARYTYLQGRPWLLPVAWVHRFFKTDVSLKKHVKEAKTILTADEAQAERLRSICRDVGL